MKTLTMLLLVMDNANMLKWVHHHSNIQVKAIPVNDAAFHSMAYFFFPSSEIIQMCWKWKKITNTFIRILMKMV